MKPRILILSVCCMFAFLTVAWAAEVDGKWTAQIPGRQGTPQETTFTFKGEGEKLTGTMTGRGGEVAISDGTIKGSAISFNVVRETPNGTFKLVYKGVLAGDEIKFTRTMEGGQGGGTPQEFVAKRVK